MSKEPGRVGFGHEVRRRRQSLEMTLQMLSERSGLTPNYIGSVENGRRDPSVSTILAIARGLGLKPSELFSVVANLSPAASEVGLLFDDVGDEIQQAVMALLRFFARRPRK